MRERKIDSLYLFRTRMILNVDQIKKKKNDNYVWRLSATGIIRVREWKNLASKVFPISFFSRAPGVISCKISRVRFLTSQNWNDRYVLTAKTQAGNISGELFCSFLRQIALPYVPRFRPSITWQIVNRTLRISVRKWKWKRVSINGAEQVITCQ